MEIHERENGRTRRVETGPLARPTDRRRGVGSLTREFLSEVSALVTAEVELVRAEVGEKVDQVERGATSLSGGAAVLYAGVLSIVGAIVLLLGLAIPLWLSALIVGIVVAAIGAGMIIAGRNRLKAQSMKPQRTMRSLREDKEFVREEAHRVQEGV